MSFEKSAQTTASQAFLKIQDVGLAPISGSGVLSALGSRDRPRHLPAEITHNSSLPGPETYTALSMEASAHTALCSRDNRPGDPAAQSHRLLSSTARLPSWQLLCYGKPLASECPQSYMPFFRRKSASTPSHPTEQGMAVATSSCPVTKPLLAPIPRHSSKSKEQSNSTSSPIRQGL